MAKAWTMMSEEMNAPTAFKRKIVRTLYGPKKLKRKVRIRTNMEIHDIL